MKNNNFLVYDPEYIPSDTMQSIINDDFGFNDPFQSSINLDQYRVKDNPIEYSSSKHSPFEYDLSDPTPEEVKPDQTSEPIQYSGTSYNNFKNYLDEVISENPEYERYRRFLTDIAKAESNFNPTVQNRAGAPAYGYFQFMQDGKKWNNISKYANTDIETFKNNPKLQIQAAIKLAQAFEKGLSKQDLELAKKQGYSINSLLAGAWLGGNGGVRNFLEGKGDASDKHWDSKGRGTSVGERMKQFNYKIGGKINKYL